MSSGDPNAQPGQEPVVVHVPTDPELVEARRRYLADRHILCFRCGYDLHGGEGQRCPECGCALSFVPPDEENEAAQAEKIIEQTRAFLARAELRCKHCKSSLRGTDGTCPGCGVVYRLIAAETPAPEAQRPGPPGRGCFEGLMLLPAVAGPLLLVARKLSKTGNSTPLSPDVIVAGLTPVALWMMALVLRGVLAKMHASVTGVVTLAMLLGSVACVVYLAMV